MNENYNPNQPQGSSGLAIASMVLGILSIVFLCSGFFAVILSVIGLILSIVSLKNHPFDGRGMAIAGLVTSIISLSIYVLTVAVGISLLSMF